MDFEKAVQGLKAQFPHLPDDVRGVFETSVTDAVLETKALHQIERRQSYGATVERVHDRFVAWLTSPECILTDEELESPLALAHRVAVSSTAWLWCALINTHERNNLDCEDRGMPDCPKCGSADEVRSPLGHPWYECDTCDRSFETPEGDETR